MMKRHHLLCLAFTLSGCASTRRAPLPPVTIDVPAAWSTSAATQATTLPTRQPTSLVAWWTRFDDPILTGLINDALVANTTIQTAQTAIAGARALRGVAAAGLGPNLSGTAQARRDTQGIAGNNSSATTGFTAGLNGSWTLDVYGGQQSALSARDAAIWARTADLGDAQVQVAAELGSTYVTLRSSQTRLAIARQNLASQSNTRQIAGWRRQAGLASAIDTQQARAAVAQTRASIPQLETVIDNSAHAIAVLTGRPPGSLTASLQMPRPVPQASGDLVLAIPAETLRQRADVRVAEYAMLEAMGQLGQADAETQPSFALGGGLSLSSRNLGTLVNGSSILSSLFGTVNLPIFDGGASKSQVGVNEAGLEQARLAYRAAVLGALQSVEDAMVVLRDDTSRLLALKDAAGSAMAASNLARLQYRAGLISFQIVLETQRVQLSAQDNLASARAAISADQINLYKALGGGWVAPTNLPIPIVTESLTRGRSQ
jgi:outer membrane protein, multidrug efflux system